MPSHPVVNLAQKLAQIHEHWRPKVVAELNGQEVKLVKFQGTFPWHHHDEADEMFLVLKGEMQVEFETQTLTLTAGELCVVPRGAEHRTRAETEAEVLILEPAGTRNTGNVEDAAFTAPNGVKL